MRATRRALAVLALAVPLPAGALTCYVSPSGSHTPPYTNWPMSATNLQPAINAATYGDTILVSNGSYRVFTAVQITNGVTVRSVNGPSNTIVWGGYPLTSNQCFVLGHSNAVLTGFTITNGWSQLTAGSWYRGGGVLVISGRVDGCIIRRNHGGDGGGLSLQRGTSASNCLVEFNASEFEGGGVYIAAEARLTHSVVVDNGAHGSGGLFLDGNAVVRHCLIARNTGKYGGGAYMSFGGTLESCTIADNVASNSAGGLFFNFGASDPVSIRNTIVYGNHAPAGSNTYFGVSVAQCNNCCIAPAPNGGTHITGDPHFVDPAAGDFRLSHASPCVGSGTNLPGLAAETDLDGAPRIVGAITDIGAYELTPLHYANATGTHVHPFLSASGGATNLQAAVDAASAGDTIEVRPGTYAADAEVLVAKPITVQSADGPEQTIVTGSGSHRVLRVASPALVRGLTVTNGFLASGNGAGLHIEGGATVQQCRVTGNATYDYGGGVFFAGPGMLESSTVIGNRATNDQGGGVYGRAGVTLRSCLIVSNKSNEGGGVMLYQGGRVENCTIAGNESVNLSGGGVRFYQGGGEVVNCIVYDNTAPVSANLGYYSSDGIVTFTCTTPAHTGSGNITNPPRFSPDGRYHLSSNSPCVNTGTNEAWMDLETDLDGYPRRVGDTVDLGSSERTPVHYVHVKGVDDWPYLDTASAARDIQKAVDAASHDDTVYIEDRTFTSTGDVVVNRRILLAPIPGSTHLPALDGQGAHRCLVLLTNAIAQDLVLTNGYAQRGGGAYLAGGGLLSNCLVTACTADSFGGGVFVQTTGVLSHCTLLSNTSTTNDGGGAYLAGGGMLDACQVRSNQARSAGGVFFDTGGYARNCVLHGNQAVGNAPAKGRGGGALFWQGGGRIDHGTVVSNTATHEGGGIFCDGGGLLVNAIIYDNTAPLGPNNYNQSAGSWSYCCTTPLLGDHPVTGPPRLIDEYRLATNSPCLDVATEILNRDIDGQWRPLDSDDSGLAVSDLGACERMNACADSDWDGMPDGWEQEHYGTPFGCTQPNGDDDLDGDSNLRESIADTDPGDPASYLRITAISCVTTGRIVQLHSSSNRLYTLEATEQPPTPAFWFICASARGNGGVLSMLASNQVDQVTNHVWDRVRVRVP
jgi:hypothetical protein